MSSIPPIDGPASQLSDADATSKKCKLGSTEIAKTANQSAAIGVPSSPVGPTDSVDRSKFARVDEEYASPDIPSAVQSVREGLIPRSSFRMLTTNELKQDAACLESVILAATKTQEYLKSPLSFNDQTRVVALGTGKLGYFLEEKSKDSVIFYFDADNQYLGYASANITNDWICYSDLEQETANKNGTELSFILYIEAVYVEPNCRNKGVGRQCLHSIAQEALNANLLNVRLHTSSTNEAACQFYDKYGFNVIDSVPCFFPEGCNRLLFEVDAQKLFDATK